MPKGTQGERPYSRYLVYRVFHKREGRYFAVLFSKKHRTTIAWAKYVLETSLGRKLKDDHQAHHKDGNKTNDAAGNLEEKFGPEHRKEHFASLLSKHVVIDCAVCGKEIIVEYNHTHWGKGPNGGTATHCSRSCGARRGVVRFHQSVKRTLFVTRSEVAALRSSVAAAIGS